MEVNIFYESTDSLSCLASGQIVFYKLFIINLNIFSDFEEYYPTNVWDIKNDSLILVQLTVKLISFSYFICLQISVNTNLNKAKGYKRRNKSIGL